MDLKDKLTLLWKYLFLAVIAYGIFSITCGINQCRTNFINTQHPYNFMSGESGTKCDHRSMEKGDKMRCGPNCQKPCCAHKNLPETPDNK